MREKDELVQYDFGYWQRQQMSQDLAQLARRVRSRVTSVCPPSVPGERAQGRQQHGVREDPARGEEFSDRDSSSIRYMVNQMYDMGMTRRTFVKSWASRPTRRTP